jgi:LacI family transcriptional regulator
MSFPRITMKDVARKSGVHVSTVSLALRNSPELPVETREKIQAVAREMGYHADPMLSALLAYRSGSAPPRYQATVAMIYDFESAAELDQAGVSYRNFFMGAAAKGEELGYKVQRFYFDGPNREGEGRRLGRILGASGIRGVILCAFRPRTGSFQLDWDQFSVVQIESQHLALAVPTVSTDQVAMAREAVRRLWQQGYRRIGIAVGREEEIYLDHAFTVGFFGEAGLHPELKPARPLLLTNGQTWEEVGRELRRWIRRHRLEAVISNWTNTLNALHATGGSAAADPVVVELAAEPEPGLFGGMVQRDTVVGERAMEQLAMLLKTNQTGCVEKPNRILIPGRWIDGTQAAAGRSRAREAAAIAS